VRCFIFLIAPLSVERHAMEKWKRSTAVVIVALEEGGMPGHWNTDESTPVATLLNHKTSNST
jgi:hypothetical protein